MKLSTKARYGLRAILDLAMHTGNRPVLVQSIADRQRLSKKYLENLLTTMKSAGLVQSVRGAKGGYLLAKEPEEITLEDIVTALEGQLEFTDCVREHRVCANVEMCPTHRVWAEMSDVVKKFLRERTLSELIQETKDTQAMGSSMYYI
jgi:Rrf2 family transcriptional regulator, cysteine metabolism repressor